MKKINLLFLSLIMLFCAGLMAQTATPPAIGDGSSGSPYQIATWQNLYWISQNPSIWDQGLYYIQTADIDFSTAEPAITTWVNDLGQGWTPIGDGVYNFLGSYDGNGHTISGLYINQISGYRIGLFGESGLGSVIENLGVISADISGDRYVGALIGANRGSITNCYCTGSVSGINEVGGLLGYNDYGGVSNCYSTCSVSGSDEVGGLLGYNDYGNVSDCYSTGFVAGVYTVGGLIGGTSEGSVSNCFWNTEYSEQPFSNGGTGKTTAEMNRASTYISAGWDFKGETPNGSTEIWNIGNSRNDGYPYLDWQYPADPPAPLPQAPALGDGSSGNPYQIAIWQNLYWITENQEQCDDGLYFIQTADIDFATAEPPITTWDLDPDMGPDPQGWTPIGQGAYDFLGSYNGNGFTISGIYINRPSDFRIGLFGESDPGSVIENLGVIGADVTGDAYMGALIGINKGTITNCYSTGSVSSAYASNNEQVGGFSGRNQGTISNCYSTCSVHSEDGTYTGGLSGYNNNIVSNCYSTGSVDGMAYVGGLLGLNIGTITNCYSIGSVAGVSSVGGLIGDNPGGTVSNCFWDTETSGQGGSDGGTGKTTAEMKTQSIFTNAGWDFIVETTNGTHDFWEMNSGFNNGYSILSWQSVEITGITTTPNIVSNSNIGFTAQSGSISLGFVEMNSTPTNLPGGAVTINKYWEISDITGGSIKLRLYYLPALTASFTGTPKIIHYNGSSWEVLPTEPEVIDGSLRYVETTNYYSSFSPVTIGDNNSPLPVELSSLTAKAADNSVTLNWETATEVNNYGFEVERLIKNEKLEIKNFETIGFVEGNGNSNSPKEYSFIDESVKNGKYSYRLKQIDSDGKFSYSIEIEVELNVIPTEYVLYQNYPNPFNPSTTIRFGLPKDGIVTLEVYNIIGEKVATLVNKELTSGYHTIDFTGSSLSSGIYLYKITAGEFKSTKKFVLMK
jgi:hypothetical protein